MLQDSNWLNTTHRCFSYKISFQRCSVRKGVLRNFPKFTGKYLCQSLFFTCAHRCFPVMNYVKLLRTRFLQNTSGYLLLFLIFIVNCLANLLTLKVAALMQIFENFTSQLVHHIKAHFAMFELARSSYFTFKFMHVNKRTFHIMPLMLRYIPVSQKVNVAIAQLTSM